MNSKLSLFALMLFLSIGASAQKMGQCASHEYLKYLDAKHPGIEAYVKNLPNQVKNDKKTRAQVITVPVVFHIVYNSAAENLTDDYITAQIDLLNKSYLRQNADTSSLRAEFFPYVGPAKVQFMLAQIIRKSTTVTKFNYIVDFWGNNEADFVKQTALGGSDAISPSTKLNVWICDLGDNTGSDGLLGFAYPPSGLPNWGGMQFPTGNLEGVVLDYLAVGGTAKLPKGNLQYGVKGKTAVHEIGHYLGLRHIWGDDDGACQGQQGFEDDGISDTPHQSDASNFNCNKNTNSCNQGAGDLKDMVENYMDYSSETCQNSFTKGQVALMESVLNNQRLLVRIPTKIEDYDLTANVSIYPNPSDQMVHVSIMNLEFTTAEVMLINNVGQVLHKRNLSKNTASTDINVQDLPNGIYFMKLVIDNEYVYNQKVMVQK